MKKIYYLPGLISAVLIPVLFWYYGSQSVQPQYTALEFALPSKKAYSAEADNTFEPFRNWNYKKIIVKPNTFSKNQEYYISELKKLQVRNEKETGIEFVIDDHNSYQDFIGLINTMHLAKQESYAVDAGKTGHFFAVHFYKDPNKNYATCGGVLGGEYDIRKPEINFSDPENMVKNLPTQAFFIIFGFLFLVNISMFSIKENLQIQKRIIA